MTPPDADGRRPVSHPLRGFILALCGAAFGALWAGGVAASPQVTQPAPGSPAFASFLAGFDNAGATHFTVNASSSDGSPLAYVWSLQNLACGSLVNPQARGNQNDYFHGATQQFPNGCPFAIESKTRVTVLVARAADLDAAGMPHDNAPYFIYSQVARAHDSTQTASLDPAPSLAYFGVAGAGSTGGAATPVQSPQGTTPPPTTVNTGSGFPVGVVIGVVVVTAAGTLAWFVVRRRGDGQVDLVHPYTEIDPGLPLPDVPKRPVATPPPSSTPPTLSTPPPEWEGGQYDEGNTGGTEEPAGSLPDDTHGGKLPPDIFGPRLPAETFVDTQVEQPTLPPHEVFTPPEPPPSPPPPHR